MRGYDPDRAQPPVAPQRPVVTEHHGVTLTDPYSWLRDPDWREAMLDPGKLDPQIRAYLEQENAHTEAVLEPIAELRRSLVAELRGRIREDDRSVPMPDGGYAYYGRFRKGGQHPLACRCPRDAMETLDGEEVLLDGDALAEGSAYFRLAGWSHSDDHRHLAYAVDRQGAEAYSIRFRDLVTGEELADELAPCNGDFEWAGDGRTLLYVVLDDEHRPRRVYRHVLGSSPQEDALVYEEPDPGFFVGVDRTESRQYLQIVTHDHTTSEVHVVPASRPSEAPRCLIPRERGVEYEASHWIGADENVSPEAGEWVLLTNREAEDFRIVRAPLETPGPRHWREWVPHRPGVLIRDLVVFRHALVRLETEDAQPRIVIRRPETEADGGDAEHAIAFEEEAYALGVAPGLEFETFWLRFTYSSLTTPARTWDYSMADGTRVLRKEQEIPSGHDPAQYVGRRLFATAPDGERVPISLLHHKDHPPGPETPVMLEGYGAYGISQPASFSPHRLSLVDRGVSFAIAHVRGGKERGYRWYRQGKGAHKWNTFNDCIACAEHLIERGCTGAGRIAVHGGSAGGMLVGVVLNERPELFGAAVADVPFVDVLNTMLDPSLPLTPPEWPEWGNPLEDPEAFQRIRDYAPYENVRAQDYPPLLVTAGVSDPRVTYWEPAKWVARLRATRTDRNPLLLYTHMSAGHGGPGGRFDFLEEVALRLGFLLWVFDRTG